MTRHFSTMLLLLLCLYFITSTVSIRHSLCTTSSLTVRGTDVVTASKGTVLIAVFMPLQCASCNRQLKRLSFMSSNLADVRVVVVAPYYEAPVTISRTQSEFPRLIIDRDVSNTWRSYDAANHDKIVFDRCGRVTQVLSHPRSDMTSYRDTLDAIDRARGHSPCGPCNYAAHEENRPQKRAKSVDSMKATIIQQRHQQTEADRYKDRERTSSKATSNRRLNNDRLEQPLNDARRNVLAQTHNNPGQDYGNARYQHQTTTVFPSWNRQMNKDSQQTNIRRSSNAIYAAQPTNSYQNYQSSSIGGQPTYRNEENPFPSPQVTRATSVPATHRGYGPDEDYEDDLLPLVKTTPFLQTQIPTPTAFDPLWPTPAPGQFFLSDPRNPQGRYDPKFTAFGEHASENNIPCSAYTDDICYQQQEKFGREGLSKCCQKGIYLTDVCIPGKCSNHTVQLCCFQKFLQARYRCCEDDRQAHGPSSTNDFNKCCYEHFVNEDTCCNMKLASKYWKTVHELCYPNTKVDYSGIKLEVRFVEGIRVVDLNEKRVWEYECRNGVNRTQYAYIP